jgi:4-hydroxy-tetrahydrodipicolinate synthase
MVGAGLAGDFERARAIHHELGDLFRALFVETNPIPVKEAMRIRGYGPANLRSPLTRLSKKHVDGLREVLATLEADDVANTYAEVER